MNGARFSCCVHFIRKRHRNVKLFIARIVVELRLIEAVVLHRRQLRRADRHRTELLRLEDLRALLQRLLVIHRRERLPVDLQNRIAHPQAILIGRRSDLHLRDENTATGRLVALDANAETIVVRIVLVRLLLGVQILASCFVAMVTGA